MACRHKTIWVPLPLPTSKTQSKTLISSPWPERVQVPKQLQTTHHVSSHLAFQIESWKDERCPATVTCFWEGNVVATIRLLVRLHRRSPWTTLARVQVSDSRGPGSPPTVDMSYRGSRLHVSGGIDKLRTRTTARGYEFPLTFNICRPLPVPDWASPNVIRFGGVSKAKSKRAKDDRTSYSVDHHEAAPERRGTGHRFLYEKNPLTERQRKYCDCLLLVKAKHTTRNPFGPCRATIRPEPGKYRCQDYYDPSRIHGDYRRALMETRSYDARRKVAYPGM